MVPVPPMSGWTFEIVPRHGRQLLIIKRLDEVFGSLALHEDKDVELWKSSLVLMGLKEESLM